MDESEEVNDTNHATTIPLADDADKSTKESNNAPTARTSRIQYVSANIAKMRQVPKRLPVLEGFIEGQLKR